MKYENKLKFKKIYICNKINLKKKNNKMEIYYSNNSYIKKNNKFIKYNLLFLLL